MMKAGGISQKLVLLYLLSLVGILHSSAKSITGSSTKNRTNTSISTDKGPPVLVGDADRSNVSRRVRENAELDCPLTGNPTPIFEWFKGEDRITEVSKVWERYNPVQGRLIIRSVTHEDSGIYVCRAVNGFGFKNYSLQLEVTGDDTLKSNLLKSKRHSNGSAPEIIAEYLPSERILKHVRGNDLILRCESKGSPKPNVIWYKGENNVTSTEESLSTLKLSNMTEKDSGRYRCESTNIFGTSIYEVILQVKEAWQGAAEILDLDPSNLTLFPGQSGSITCSARLEGATLPIMVWVKKLDRAPESKNEKFLQHDGIYYEALNRTAMRSRSRNVYYTVLPINNASSADAGVYGCAVIGLMGIVDNHSRAHVIIASDPQRQKPATVQTAVLWAFGFVILLVLVLVCLSRIYGCRGPLKNSSKPIVVAKPPKPATGKTQVPKRSPGETLSTTLTQNQNDVLQPLVDGHNSRTISTSISAPRQHGGSSNGGGCVGGGRHNKMYYGGDQLLHSLNSTHSCNTNTNTNSCGVESDNSASSKNGNYVMDQDSCTRYFVNAVDPFNSWSTVLAKSGYRHRDRDRGRDRMRNGDRDRDKYRKRWSRKYSCHGSDHMPSLSAVHLPVPAPSCESSSSDESAESSEVNYYYEPERHEHHHYYHHTHNCPKTISPTHLNNCIVIN